MGKYLRKFQTVNDFSLEKDNLPMPWVAYIVEQAEDATKDIDVRYRILKMLDCIQNGYFSLDSNTISSITELPYSLDSISDFANVCISNRDLNGNITDKPFVFNLRNNSFLTEEQKSQFIDILNKSEVRRSLSDLQLQNLNFPDKDVIINRYGSDSLYHYDSSIDFASGSTFNSVKIINKRGNISSMNSLFRRADMKTLELVNDGGIFSPTDLAGFTEFCGNLTSYPNTIEYHRCTNIGWICECCYALPEIPSYYSVTNEEERVNTLENTFGGSNGFTVADQAFNQCVNLTKIGPVFDCRKLNPGSNGTPYLMFNNCTNLSDVRFKNLSNGDWDFSTAILNMDVESIKYSIENLAYQPEHTWANMKPTASVGVSVGFNEDANTLMFLWPTHTTHLRDFVAPTSNNFKVIIPNGYVLSIFGYDKDYKYTGECLSVTGDGSEKTVSFTSADAVLPYITLTKTDGSALTPSSVKDLAISICYYNSNTSAYTDNQIPSNTHTLNFSGKFSDKISDKAIIPASTIQNANDKGWRIYTSGIEITPDGDIIYLNYRFKFTDWEINDAYENDIEVTDTSVKIKKFRPNMWIIRSQESLNSTDLSTNFKNIYFQTKGINQYASTIFSYRFYANGAVGGDGGTKGSILGLGILPYSLHSTPTTYYAPELPFSSYVWDSATKTDGSTVQVGSETTAWRGDWGCGYNGYGFRNDYGKKLVYPDITTFPTPYNNYKLAMGLYTGNIHTFDRWWADNTTLKGYVNILSPFKVTLCGRRDTTSTSTSKMWATQEVFNNVKFRISGMLADDYIKWSHTSSSIVDMDGNTITQIDTDGDYIISNTGVDGGFILYGNDSLTGTNPVTFEIIDNPDYIDENGYIDISDNPITIELIYETPQTA